MVVIFVVNLQLEITCLHPYRNNHFVKVGWHREGVSTKLK